MDAREIDQKPHVKNARKIFWQKGTCSQTFFHILNQEFDNPHTPAEKAVDQLAGGIMQRGHQCGMLWGATMASGLEASKKFKSCKIAQMVAIHTAKKIMDSFEAQTETVNCKDVTDCDFRNQWSFARYMITGKFLGCFRLAKDWAPNAVDSAIDGLSHEIQNPPELPISCAAELIRRLGGTEEEQVMASGLAGGMGLQGNGCGALAAAIWYSGLQYVKDDPKNKGYKNPNSKRILDDFLSKTDGKMLCSEITGKKFENVEQHSEFLKSGGCKKLIDVLSVT